MKNIKIIYWTTTILFAGFMLFSAIPDLTMDADAVQFITHLGYPEYFIPFIGVAKLLGSIALVVPAFKKIKEWAYAGLFFDLIGATYSLLKVVGWDSSMVFIVLIFAIGITSYVYNDKVYNSPKAA